MPISLSAKKKVRQDVRRKKVNSLIRNQYRLALKKARQTLKKADLILAEKRLDRAAKKGVIHPNKAARLKSRLQKFAHLKKVAAKKSTAKEKKPAARKKPRA